MGHFKVISKVNLDELELDAKIQESDYCSLTASGNFVQLKYVDDEEQRVFEIRPGIFTIEASMDGMYLKPTSFVTDSLLNEFTNTETLSKKIDAFFTRLHIYAKHGIEVPKRAALLYGPAGTGKSSSIIKATEKYRDDKKTLILLWATDKFEAYQVKDFVKTFDYAKNGIERVILIAEDIGGSEMEQVKVKSDSSLLSLLDNQEKTFSVPIFIIATTNYPEIFLGNLTNRPSRFNDKIEMGFPSKEFRVALFKFYAKGDVTEESTALIESDKCREFTADHIKEVVVRADLMELTIEDTIKQVQKEIATYKEAFTKQGRMGFGED